MRRVLLLPWMALLVLCACNTSGADDVAVKVGSQTLCASGWTGYNAASQPTGSAPVAYYENSSLVLMAGCSNEANVFSINFGSIAVAAGATAPCSSLDINFVTSGGTSDTVDPPETTNGSVTLTESSGSYFATGSCVVLGSDDSGTATTITVQFKDIPFSPG